MKWLLALSDAWSIGLTGAQLLFNLLVTVVLGYLAAKNREIEALKAELKKSASDVIDTRMAGIEARLEGSIRSLNAVVADMQRRLERGDQHLHSLSERDHRQELKTHAMLAELKDWVRDNAAQKPDVEALRAAIDELRKAECAK